MKTTFGFLMFFIIVVYNTHAADMVSKIIHRNKERGLNLESNDDLCMGRCHVLSDVLLQFGELKESVNQLSQTVNQQSQTVNQQSQIINQLSQSVNQQNRRKDVCGDGWIEHGDSCYYFSLEDEVYSWPNALLQCRAKGGYLAEIDNQDENSFIETQAQFIGSSAASGSSSINCRESFLTGYNKIPDSALSASGSYDSNHLPVRGRLNTQAAGGKVGSWVGASKTDLSQWIQADLQQLVKMTGVVTQGRQDMNQWVTSFAVYHSSDCVHWAPIKGPNGFEKIFTGNTDRNTKIINIFPEPVTARCIRINPRGWNSYTSMRFDVRGCTMDTMIPKDSPDLSWWLGGTDILHEGEFLWATSGTRIAYDTFRDWHPRQPDNSDDSEHCVMMNKHSGWHDIACSKLNRYVCEKDNQ